MRVFVRFVLPAVALSLLAALLIGPRLIDQAALRTALTGQLSTALGRPVDIGRFEVRLLPQPAVIVEQVAAALGDHPDELLRVGSIHATLSPRALLERRILFTRIEVDTLVLNPRLVGALRQTATAFGTGTAGGRVDVRLQQARLSGLTVIAPDGLRLGPFTATLDWNDGTRPEHIAIVQDDGHLQARIGLTAAGVDVHLQANDWTPPVYAPLHTTVQVTHLDSHARYADGRLEILAAEVTGPVGRLQLQGRLDWTKAWQFDGELVGERVDLPLLLTSFGQASVPGLVDGRCGFKLQGANVAQLFRTPGLDCSLHHTHAGKTAQIELTTRPEADKLGYNLHATDLTLPVGPALHFDSLEMRGSLAAGELSFAAARAAGYQGALDMQGVLSWRTGWQWEFSAHSRKIRLDPLLAVFDQHNLDGRLDADCEGRLASDRFSALAQQPRLVCDFSIADGVLRNADLEQAARLIKSGTKTAGSTPFDHLSGRLKMHAGQADFSGLKLRSTALEASGAVSIHRDRTLSGELDAGLKNTGGMVSVPLVVSGVLGDPVIRPTTSAMAGGAAGTVLLGPGVGTAVGMKVGQAFSKMTRWLKPKSEAAAEPSQD